MFTIIFWWLVMGVVGSSMVFYDDLRTGLRWSDVEVTLGVVFFHLILALLGPFILFIAIRETKFLESFVELIVEIGSRFTSIKLFTIKRNNTDEGR